MAKSYRPSAFVKFHGHSSVAHQEIAFNNENENHLVLSRSQSGRSIRGLRKARAKTCGAGRQRDLDEAKGEVRDTRYRSIIFYTVGPRGVYSFAAFSHGPLECALALPAPPTTRESHTPFSRLLSFIGGFPHGFTPRRWQGGRTYYEATPSSRSVNTLDSTICTVWRMPPVWWCQHVLVYVFPNSPSSPRVPALDVDTFSCTPLAGSTLPREATNG